MTGMQALGNTHTTTAYASPVPGLDGLAQAAAWALSKVSKVTGAGAFWVAGGPAFVDAWVEPSPLGGGSFTVRLGRLELVADWRA
jgi:hypothetical protein